MRHVLLKLLLGLLLLPFVLVAAYFGVAWALLLWPVASHGDDVGAAPVLTAYVQSNGVHTDLVFPIRAEGVDWSQAFPAADFTEPPADAAFVAIGWGDREFYLHTPRWQDLTARRALQAVSGSGRTLLHVSYLREADLRHEGSHALPLSRAQYASLVTYVRAAMRSAGSGRAVNLPGQRYGANDAFYEAQGAYGLFTTCNVWTGRGLRQAGVKVSPWTPLASQVVWHLPR